MTLSLRRALLPAIVALSLSAAAFAEAPGKVGPAVEPDRARWPQDVSHLQVDPAVRYGVLPNGLRYAIMKNAQPKGIASVRLRIAAGSLYETDKEQGIAHFIEHMNFNGSKNVPEGDMVKILQRTGLAFGADTNAYTSFRETVYQLDLPNTDEKTVDTAFMLFRESADRLTFAPAAIDRERGVVLSEERQSDTPEQRLSLAETAFSLPGQPLAERFPIGQVATIKSVTHDDFARFYGDLYAPDRAFLVVAGDIDPNAIEAKIKAKFSDWTRSSGAPRAVKTGILKKRRAEAGHYVEAGLPASVSLSWLSAPDLRPDSEATRQEGIVRGLAVSILQRRYQRLSRAANAPFIGVEVDRSVFERSATEAGLDISVRPGEWKKGLAAAEQELRRALKYGFQQSELDREIAEFRTSYQQAAAGAATRDTRRLADQLVGAYGEDYAFTPPSYSLALFEKTVKGLTPAAVAARFRADFKGEGPLVFVSGSEEIPGGNAAILAAYKESAKTPVAKPDEEKAVAFDYSFGAPGQVAERKHDGEFDFDAVRFQNGVRLTIKKTPFEQDRVRINVRFPGGLVGWPKDKPGLSALSRFVMGEAGLGKMTQEEVERFFADKQVGAGFGIGADDLDWGGVTRPADLDDEMRLLAAYTTDPGFRSQGLERIQQAAENFIKQYATAPERVLARDSDAILRSGDGRWKFPNLEEIRALKMDDFRAAILPTLQTAPIEVSIVGDVDVEKAIAATAATFGALPPRKEAPLSVDAIRFPAGTAAPIRLTHEGRPEQSSAFVAWPAVDFSDTRRARAVRLARLILENRLVEDYREEQGATYSPGTDEEFSDAFPGYGYVAASVEIPTGQADQFFKTVDKITKDLKAGKFDDDALLRARGPAIDQLKTAERGNGFWSSILQDVQTNPRRLPQVRTRITELQAITKDEIVKAAKETFDDAKAIKIVVLPAKTS